MDRKPNAAKTPIAALLPDSLTEEQFKTLKPLTWVQVAWQDSPDSFGLIVGNDLLVSKPGYYRTTYRGMSILNVTGEKGKEEVRFMIGINREQIRHVIGEVNRPRFMFDTPAETANAPTDTPTSNTTPDAAPDARETDTTAATHPAVDSATTTE